MGRTKTTTERVRKPKRTLDEQIEDLRRRKIEGEAKILGRDALDKARKALNAGDFDAAVEHAQAACKAMAGAAHRAGDTTANHELAEAKA